MLPSAERSGASRLVSLRQSGLAGRREHERRLLQQGNTRRQRRPVIQHDAVLQTAELAGIGNALHLHQVGLRMLVARVRQIAARGRRRW